VLACYCLRWWASGSDGSGGLERGGEDHSAGLGVGDDLTGSGLLRNGDVLFWSSGYRPSC
jgi:hypothetical protein